MSAGICLPCEATARNPYLDIKVARRIRDFEGLLDHLAKPFDSEVVVQLSPNDLDFTDPRFDIYPCD